MARVWLKRGSQFMARRQCPGHYSGILTLSPRAVFSTALHFQRPSYLESLCDNEGKQALLRRRTLCISSRGFGCQTNLGARYF